ncbi:MAG: phosphotransferase [Hellea sp.]|jgi:aminoglycoside phosphotransferase (APT) family kinase protein|nr:phosphotransferase [Hellea sp.]
MDISALPEATIACLAAASEIYVGAKVLEISPISGGYSRLTFKYSIRTKNGDEDIVLQYVPLGATGIVRIDRMVENDILVYLSENEGVNSPKLIASDVKGNFFDNAAFIYKAEPGRPFVDVCRDTQDNKLGALNRIVARSAASVHGQDIKKLPNSMHAPTNWEDYLTSQIELFKKTESESSKSRPFLRYMAKWLDENRPPAAPLSLVHGDFQVSNMLSLNSEKDALLVDWELAHIGDPREDLGWLTMVCNTIPPDILAADPKGFYDEYRAFSGLSKEIINPETSAYFLIISSIRTHRGMMKSSDALAKDSNQAQSVLAAYYLSITSYQHTMWMNAVKIVEEMKRSR